MALPAISLFAGAGGFDLGLERAGIARTVCRVEHEAYAAAVLAARSEDGSLAQAPVWSDVVTFDGRPWRGIVDLIFGGFPCQDVSNAGKRTGIKGERSGLWSHFARIVREVGPKYVFVENVSALVIRGLDSVLADLHALGYDAEWGTFRASHVGAPHRRERVFILGAPRRMERIFARQVADTKKGYVQAEPVQFRYIRPEKVEYRGGGRNLVANEWPPGPTDADGWEAYLLRNPCTEPAIRRGADGMASRVHRLRLLGNGVVPDQAVLAWRVLWERMMEPANRDERRTSHGK